MITSQPITMQQAVQELGTSKCGSYQYRRILRHYLNRIPDDFRAAGCDVPTVTAINRNAITQMVRYWFSQTNSTAVVAQKLSVLRKICKHYHASFDFPGTTSLCGRYVHQKSICFKAIPICTFKAKKIKQLAWLQCHLGLKKQEAVRFQWQMILPTYVLIPRHVAYNKKDRMINISTELHGVLWANFSAQRNNNQQVRSEKLTNQYTHALRLCGIDDDDNYRYVYIYYLNQSLQSTSAKKRKQVLCRRTGYRSLLQLEEILKCLEKSSMPPAIMSINI